MALQAWMPHGGGGAFERHLRGGLDDEIVLTVGKVPPAAGYDVLVAGRPEPEWIEDQPALRWVLIPFAGVPPATLALLREHPGIGLHNLHHNAAPTAEMAVALMLAAAKRIVPLDRALRLGDWRARYDEQDRGLLLEGRRALVVGRGAIGRRVERALEGLGMEVVGLGRRDGAPALDRHLPRAHVVVVAVPSTEKTRGLFDQARLAQLPSSAVVVNVSRGDVFDEEALYRALASNRLGAAGLDVWWHYPPDEAARASTPPSAHPFGELDNVVLSPHRAGHTDRTEALRAEHLSALLRRAARGQPLENGVDLALGY